MAGLLECVVNVSEGSDTSVLARLRESCREHLLDVHTDADHNRSVFTLCGPGDGVHASACSLAGAAVGLLDLRGHSGVHPRIGTLDVVPWVSLTRGAAGYLVDGSPGDSVASRSRFASWAGDELQLPCFLYGLADGEVGYPSLPEVRRRAWADLAPATGPSSPHPRAGACAVGARPALVAYNLWLAGRGVGGDIDTARSIAREMRARFEGRVRTLALQVGPHFQVSCNLTDPWTAGPGAAFDFVASRTAVARAELVGLVPAAVLNAEPRHRWPELGLDSSMTIEARLERAGLDGGRFGHW